MDRISQEHNGCQDSGPASFEDGLQILAGLIAKSICEKSNSGQSAIGTDPTSEKQNEDFSRRNKGGR